MGNEYNIFTRSVKTIMMTYAILTSVAISHISNNIDTTIREEVKYEATLLDDKNKSFTKSIIEEELATFKETEQINEPPTEDIQETTNEYQSEDDNNTSIFSYDEKHLIAKVCLAEAEDQTELGKRLVISTILNRIDSEVYADNVYDVVYQPYQFEVMSNGRIDKVTVTDEVIQLVEEEIVDRTNEDVIYFRMDYYSEYGTPLFVEDDHYFSGF